MFPSFTVLGPHACLSKWSTIKLPSKPLENVLEAKVPSKMNLRTPVTRINENIKPTFLKNYFLVYGTCICICNYSCMWRPDLSRLQLFPTLSFLISWAPLNLKLMNQLNCLAPEPLGASRLLFSALGLQACAIKPILGG